MRFSEVSIDYSSLKESLERFARSAYLVIEGGRRLEGTLKPQGSKNGALPLIAGATTLDKPVKIRRVNPIRDIRVMLDIFSYLGGSYEFNLEEESVYLDPRGIDRFSLPWDLTKQIHASFDFLGALLFRFGEAEVPLPGGCVLGTRGVDIHLDGLKALGYQVWLENGVVKALGKRPKGGTFRLKKRSVGATKNLLMASLRAQEPVILDNVSVEPEVIQLVNFLKGSGAEIEHLAPYTIKVYPYPGELLSSPDEFINIPDRIEIGTYVLAVLATRGSIEVRDLIPEHMESFHSLLKNIGVEVLLREDGALYFPGKELNPIEVATEPYPGFPTDLQPPLVAFLTTVPGRSIVRETIFNNRFAYVPELLRLGADIQLLDNHTAVITGGRELKGAPMMAPDIRAGAALVVAALASKGQSKVENYLVLDRGYWNLEGKLRELGGEVALRLPLDQ